MTRETAIAGRHRSTSRARSVALLVPILLAILPLSTARSEAGSSCRRIEHRSAALAAPQRQDSGLLARAVRQSRAAGCGPQGFASPHDTHCRAHARRIQELQAAGFAPGGRDRGRILAAPQAGGCQGREATPRRVARADRAEPAIRAMDGTIPVPLPRPMSPAEIYQTNYVQHGRSRIAAIDLARLERLSRPRDIPADRQAVRVVGGRFLAQPDQHMDFAAISTASDNVANELLGDVLAVIGDAIVPRAVAAEP